MNRAFEDPTNHESKDRILGLRFPILEVLHRARPEFAQAGEQTPMLRRDRV